MWLLLVGSEAHCRLISGLQVLLGPPVHGDAVGEAQPRHDTHCGGVLWDGGGHDVLHLVVAAAVVADGRLRDTPVGVEVRVGVCQGCVGSSKGGRGQQ